MPAYPKQTGARQTQAPVRKGGKSGGVGSTTVAPPSTFHGPTRKGSARQASLPARNSTIPEQTGSKRGGGKIYPRTGRSRSR